MIEDEIQAHQDQIDNVQTQVRRFVEANHFMIDRIEDQGRELVNRYNDYYDKILKILEYKLNNYNNLLGIVCLKILCQEDFNSLKVPCSFRNTFTMWKKN